MKGGNGVRNANGITHSPIGERAEVRDARANLTRRCGGAEDVREVLKITLCSLWFKFLGGRRRPRTSRSVGLFTFKRFLEAFVFLDGFRRQVVARGRATSKGGFRLRRFDLHNSNVSVRRWRSSLRSRPRVNTRGSPIISLHYRLPFLCVLCGKISSAAETAAIQWVGGDLLRKRLLEASAASVQQMITLRTSRTLREAFFGGRNVREPAGRRDFPRSGDFLEASALF